MIMISSEAITFATYYYNNMNSNNIDASDIIKKLIWSNTIENNNNNNINNNSKSCQKIHNNIAYPWSKDEYFKRVKSYAKLWYGKPIQLNPLICSRYGWYCTSKDTLSCQLCKQSLKITIKSGLKANLAESKIDQYVYELNASHNDLCPFKSNPSPESFSEISLESVDLEKLFWNRVLSYKPCIKELLECLKLKTESQLPAIEATFHYEEFHKGSVDKGVLETISDKMRACLDILPNQESKLVYSHLVIIWSAFGWKADPSLITLTVECEFCSRIVNISKLVGHKHYETVGQKRSRSSGGKIMNMIDEHRIFCPWKNENIGLNILKRCQNTIRTAENLKSATETLSSVRKLLILSTP